MKEGRLTWAELGERLGLSAPAAAERVRKLEERGVIRGFAALADPEIAGFPVLAYVFVTLESQAKRKVFAEAVRKHEAIQECHHVAGEDDFLLKVRCRGMKELERLLAEDLKSRMGIARTRTTVVLGTAKESIVLPVDKS